MANNEWHDDMLLHPDGRANNNEPCIRCKKPIAKKTYYKHRDKHVCGYTCNKHIINEFYAKVKSQNIPIPSEPRPTDPRDKSIQHIFGMNGALDKGIPFHYFGFGPINGDILYRWGERTLYIEGSIGDNGIFFTYVHESGHSLVYYNMLSKNISNIAPWHFFEGEELSVFSSFDYRGKELIWHREKVRCLDEYDIVYDWEAYACVPSWVGSEDRYHSPEYAIKLAKNIRISANTSKAKLRTLKGVVIDDFDPLDIFERDNWICQICFTPVNPSIKYPDKESATLDHIFPLSKGGSHTKDNTQLAHWSCNIKKGNKIMH